jgi:hypothetical protein
VDVLVGNAAGRTRLLMNNVGTRKHWLGLRLVGDHVPRDMYGARVAVFRPSTLRPFDPSTSSGSSRARSRDDKLRVVPSPIEGRQAQGRPEPGRGTTGAQGAPSNVEGRASSPTLWRRARADGSYASANDPRVLVGLGDSAEPPRVRIVWPDGRVEEFPGVAVDRYTTLKEGSATAGSSAR